MCFYVVNMQVRIYHKKTNNHTNTGKTGTRVEDEQKVKAGDPKVNFSLSSIQTWQD